MPRKIQNRFLEDKPSFVTLDVTDKDTIRLAGSAVNSYQGVHRSDASARDTYRNIDTNTSVRDQFSRSDYEYFRSNESIPRRQQEIISMCMQAYRKVGLIRNIIDLMADFGAEGVRLVHPNPRIQKFFRGWFKRVNGIERTERFLNILYRCGNVLVNRSMAKIDLKDERRMKALGADEILEADIEKDNRLRPTSRTIPYRYIFINPLTVELLGKDIAQFVGKQIYAIKIHNNLRRAITTPKNKYEQELIQSLPDDLRQAILSGQPSFPLDPKKVSAYFYKKDDWQEWADPLVYAILDDLILLEKMKLADLAALDGAISQVRLWKLGDLDNKIFPTDVAVNKLAEILLSNPGGGAFDLIWGPELTLEETSTEVHAFLGGEKYEPVLNSIYAGLGVPPTLTGAATASGFTNNYISLKTLVERLEYGRQIVKAFWEQEIELVRQAMGYQRGAVVEFGHMTLSDEAAEKALLIQLADRDMLSINTVLERFGEIPEIESLKRRREDRQREAGVLTQKASPYHAPEKMHERVVAALSRGYITPEQADIEIPVEFQNQKSPFDKQLDAQLKAKSMTGGQPSQPKKKSGGTGGRPTGKKDSSKRSRTPKPAGASEETVDFLATLIWAKEAQVAISDFVTPGILEHFNKKNVRSLTAEEAHTCERIKFDVLCAIEPYTEIDEHTITSLLNSNVKPDTNYLGIYNAFQQYIKENKKRNPTVDELRLIQASTYATVHARTQIRNVVQGVGQTESEAYYQAKENAREAHTSFWVISTNFSKIGGSWVCTLIYEYELDD